MNVICELQYQNSVRDSIVNFISEYLLFIVCVSTSSENEAIGFTGCCM